MITLTLLAQGSAPTQHWKFQSETTIRIGRSPDNDVVINDPLVSRYHLELRKVSDRETTTGASVQWQMINQGANGTLLNGVLVSQALVNHDCLIQLARSGPILKFQIQASSPMPLQVCTHAGNLPSSLFCIHCGQPVVQKQHFIRQYQVLRTLGKGGMGTTYLAWDKEAANTKRPQILVVKEMNADMEKIEKAQELFEREARILNKLHHPGIPKYYDFFIEKGKKYLAMELVHGQDLEKRIHQFGAVTVQQAIEWMIQTCDILDYIHGQDPPLIHRDIKPANLMARNLNNNVVILDFGAVKEITDISMPLATLIGAEGGYCAPEQYKGQPVTQSDLYAIGPTLIFLLTGESPMNFYRQRGREYRFEVQNIPTITPKLAKLIDRVTSPAPRDRYQTAKELSQALQACT